MIFLKRSQHDTVVQGLVLVAQRIDRRRNAELGNGQLLRKVRHRKDSRVILLDPGPQKIPDVRLGRRYVDVTAPDPRASEFSLSLNQPGRLRIVDNDYITGEIDFAHIHFGGIAKNFEHLGTDLLLLPVQCIMKRFGYVEELLIALDEVPVRFHTEFPEQTDHACQNFGNAATHGCRVNVLHAAASHAIRQHAQLLDDTGACDFLIILEFYHYFRRRSLPILTTFSLISSTFLFIDSVLSLAKPSFVPLAAGFI